ncbi:hypothetical protein TNCV_3732831 [Trichonephila clavipes]|nr:hypothetical protein TNCV_3732831 [Trichonephila clavipes]
MAGVVDWWVRNLVTVHVKSAEAGPLTIALVVRRTAAESSSVVYRSSEGLRLLSWFKARSLRCCSLKLSC